MAEVKKNNVGMIAFWSLFALAALGAVVYFAWNRTDDSSSETNTNTNVTVNQKCDQKSTMLTETDRLNANEVEFTACNFDQEVLQAKGVVVVDAYASWCPHCQKLAPIIAKIADDYAGRAKVGKLNANNQDPAMKANFDFARSNGLESYPTVWIYKDGQKVETFSGERSYEEVKELIDKHL